MKTALITGANSGIGLALTQKLLSEGYNVYGGSRSGRIDGVTNSKLHTVQLDITDEAGITAALKHIYDSGDTIDLLINNAGAGIDIALGKPEHKSFTQTLDTNVTGTVFFTEKALPLVNNGGTIVFISSAMGLAANIQPNAPAYRISKAAINIYAIMLAERLLDKDITVVPMHPGWVQTNMGGNSAPLTTTDAAGLIYKGITSSLPTGKFYNAATGSIESY